MIGYFKDGHLVVEDEKEACMKNCDSCGRASKYLLVNGEEQTPYCKECIKEETGDMVVSNDHIEFSLRENADGMILILVGAS